MKWFGTLAAIVFSAVSALAEQVLVSTGNTDETTRLVLTFEQLPKWSSAQSGRTLELQIEGSGLRIAPAEVAMALDNPRIASLATDEAGETLRIELSCDCVTDVYPFGTGSLIVEVRQPLTTGPIANAESSAPVPPPSPSAEGILPSVEPRPDSAIPTLPPRPLADLTDHVPSAPNSQQALPWPTTMTGLGLMDRLGFSVRSDAESQAVSMISRELSRAAAQGLVASGPETPPDHRRSPTEPAPPVLADRSNIKIVTSLDRAVSATLGKASTTNDGRKCFPDSEVDLSQWGDTSEISTIGALRRNAYGENGDVTPEGARDLARYYIALGFGSEAAAAARFMEDGAQKELLLAMAEIVDHGASNAAVLDGQINCRGQVALWAALSRPIEDGTKPASVEVILSTFSALAPHHRAHLGPVLAERLRAVGLADAARNAVNAVARGGLQSNESELVTARLELDGTRPAEARDTLVEISNGTDVTAAEALLELLEDAERRGMAPNPAWVEDAPSLSRATEGSEVAPRLNLAGLRGRIALGQFDELRLALADDTPGLDPVSRNRLAISAVTEAARHADDAEFLRSEVGLSKLLTVEDMERKARFEVADRLLSIGLASRATDYLIGEPGTAEELETLVRVYAATGQSHLAVSVLKARSDDSAARQLGMVLSEIGQNGPAVQAFEDGGSLEEAAHAAIRAGDWEWIAQREIAGTTGALSDAARSLGASTGDTGLSSNPDEPENGRLIMSSQELRQHARALLIETDLSSEQVPFTN